MSKTKKIMAGVTSTALALSLAACGTQSAEEDADILPVPEDEDCEDWEWDDDEGVWKCDEKNSRFFGHYFFLGRFFGNSGLLAQNRDYQSYKNSAAFKGGAIGDNKTIKRSTGFGSGSKSTGG
ncbi:aminotransferase yhxA [Mesobacillus harenae]|uniref:aminotransferase yhxA n=1 Tax=Mesobacillus harenae TaxID=2213203 RepID=UPI00157FE035|nr:aminotransferase yhxA [Mesobacillus harenae]